MKKLILSTVAIAALTFASCKKDNLQPAVNSTTNIEQTNLETADDDKAVDTRNKFVGVWKNSTVKITITKASSNRLKIVNKYTTGGQKTLYGKVVGTAKKRFQAYPYQNTGDLLMLEGEIIQPTGFAKKMKCIYNYEDFTSPDQILVKQ